MGKTPADWQILQWRAGAGACTAADAAGYWGQMQVNPRR
jgi:hypothetical protein